MNVYKQSVHVSQKIADIYCLKKMTLM